MNNKEIKESTTADLIYKLSALMVTGNARWLIASCKEARMICDELQKRGVIGSADYLYEIWERRYKA